MEEYNYHIATQSIEITRSEEGTKILLDDLTIEILKDRVDVSADGVTHCIRYDGGSERLPEGMLAYTFGRYMNFVWWGCYVAISVSDGHLCTVDYEHTHLAISPSGEILKEEYDAPIRRFSPKIE